MNREQARKEIRKQISCKDYLTKSKNGLYCCPYCGSGTGRHKTGAVKLYKTNTWTCHACKKSGDVIDLFQKIKKISYNTALLLLADKLGISIETYRPEVTETSFESTQEKFFSNQDVEMPKNNYTAYYQKCREQLNHPMAISYLQSRGISLETAKTHWIGFDLEADPAKSNHPCARLIIPTSPTHYIGRRIDGRKDFEKLNSKGSTPAIFNSKALYSQETREIFVTEGAFDALSVLEMGYTAIALNSTANANELINLLEQNKTSATLILCLDNDQGGQNATEILRNGLKRLNITHITADICIGYKDPNEALINDKNAFLEAIEQAQKQTAAKPDNTKYYIDFLMADEIKKFKDDKKTGFTNLDKKAGSLYAGLYVLAAISSLGKTSFALQLADQLAENGHDVIFFSLEQSRLELISKSLARRMAQKNRAEAFTSLEIRKGNLSPLVINAIKEYKEAIGDRLSIVEGNFSCNSSFIGNYLRKYIQRNKINPVVFIDYLQILQPADNLKKQSTKEAIDSIVVELKRISRELNLTLIAISSVNRANYLTPIDFESLKESGNIEFSCDVLWGLQLQCLKSSKFDKVTGKVKEQREIVKQAKASEPRKIELSCLKNRYGIANYSCCFNYYPAHDLFTEDAKQEINHTDEKDVELWQTTMKI